MDLGVDVDRNNRQGFTPLHTAILDGSLDVVTLLVGVGADVLYSPNTRTNVRLQIVTTIHDYAIELQSEASTEFRCDWEAVTTGYQFGHQSCQRTVPLSAIECHGCRACILQERLKLPPVVTAVILGYAGYRVKAATRRDEHLMGDQDAPESPYVKVRVQGWGGKLPVQQVIFRTPSHNQGKSPDTAFIDIRSKLTVLYTGFSGYPEQHGTCRGSSTWFEARVQPAQTGISPIRFQDNVHPSRSRSY